MWRFIKSAKKKQELGGGRFFLRVLTALVAVNLLTVGVMSFTAYDFNRTTVAKHAKDNIVQQVDILADRFDESYRQSVDRALHGLISARSLDEYLLGSKAERLVLRRKIEREYLRLLDDYPAFYAVRFIDSQGAMTIGVKGGKRSSSNIPLENLARKGNSSLRNVLKLWRRVKEQPLLLSSGNMEWFMPPREVVLLGPFEGDGGVITALAALPKLDADTRQMGGVVMIEIRLDQWFDELQQLHFFEQNPVWVFDPHQKSLLHPTEGNLSFDPTPFLGQAFAGKTAIVDIEPGLSAYRDLSLVPGQPLVRVAVALPHEVLVQDFRPAIRFFSFVLLASIALLMLVSYVISRYLAKPVVALQTAQSRLANAQRIAKLGNWSLDLEKKEVQFSDHALIILGADDK